MIIRKLPQKLHDEGKGIPFVITIGIYGIMFDTLFVSDKNKAIEYVELKKNLINRLLELYDIEEGKRNTIWNEKHNKLVDKINSV